MYVICADQEHRSGVDFLCSYGSKINSTQRATTSVKRHSLLIGCYQHPLHQMFTQTCLEFVQCTNPRFILKIAQGVQIIPQTVAEQIRAHTLSPDDIILLINLSLALKGKICVWESLYHHFKISLPTVQNNETLFPPLDKCRVYFHGFFSLISCRKCLSTLSV